MRNIKIYYYNEPDGDFSNVVVRMTRQEILNEYWDFWSNKMVEKYGEGHELITQENCIKDWCVTHWAWSEDFELEDLPEVSQIQIVEDEENDGSLHSEGNSN